MTKEEFQQLQLHQKESGLGLMHYLKRESIPYSNYNYWNKKFSEETERNNKLPLAPITFTDKATEERAVTVTPFAHQSDTSAATPEGISVMLPNGVRAHFSPGMASAALQLLTQNLIAHVLPE